MRDSRPYDAAIARPIDSSKVLIVFGAVLLAVALFYATNTARILHAEQTVRGTVVELFAEPDRRRPMLYPVFEYTHQGRTYRGRASVGSASPTHAIGETAVLSLDPRDPTKFVTDSFLDRWGLPVVVSSIGGLLLALGRKLRRREREPLTEP